MAFLIGCQSVPPDMQTDMLPPDGVRPNNFGRLVAGSEKGVEPDRPTIGPRGGK